MRPNVHSVINYIPSGSILNKESPVFSVFFSEKKIEPILNTTALKQFKRCKVEKGSKFEGAMHAA